MHIEIERMMFGDYRVQVWNKELQSELDREYFCRGYTSAYQTAIEIRNISSKFSKLPIFLRETDELIDLEVPIVDTPF